MVNFCVQKRAVKYSSEDILRSLSAESGFRQLNRFENKNQNILDLLFINFNIATTIVRLPNENEIIERGSVDKSHLDLIFEIPLN